MVQHRTGSGRLKVTRSFVAASRVASCARSVAVARREVMLPDPIGLHTRMPLVSLILNAKKRKKKKYKTLGNFVSAVLSFRYHCTCLSTDFMIVFVFFCFRLFVPPFQILPLSFSPAFCPFVLISSLCENEMKCNAAQ